MVKELSNLKNYIEDNDYRGYDPYDALKSPLFNLPFFKSNKFIRFGTQQFVKRFPFSVRSILRVPKGKNPVTLGLCIQAYAYLYEGDLEGQDKYLEKIDDLVKELKSLIPPGFSGSCWGYDFDWEARYANIPAYQPTVVATGIITNALFIAYKLTGHNGALELVISASNFVKNDLNKTYFGDEFCFSYSPFDKLTVFNASMKGARLLTQVYSITNDISLLDLAKNSINFVVNNQKSDGSWSYSLLKNGALIDNYHTGYVLDCLDEFQQLTNDLDYMDNINLGYIFYKSHFITTEGIPKFYNDKIYPIDCTSASQTILTCVRFKDYEIARSVAKWTVENMQKKNGSFKFRRFKNYTINTSFMRWSDAWMFAALSNLNYISK